MNFKMKEELYYLDWKHKLNYLKEKEMNVMKNINF